jgi:hypothetical protein
MVRWSSDSTEIGNGKSGLGIKILTNYSCKNGGNEEEKMRIV